MIFHNHQKHNTSKTNTKGDSVSENVGQRITLVKERAMWRHQPPSQKDYEEEDDETPREYEA